MNRINRSTTIVSLALLLVLLFADRLAAQSSSLRLTTAVVSPGQAGSVDLRVEVNAAEPIGGLSFGLDLPAGFTASAFDSDAEFLTINQGAGFATVGVLFSISGLELRGPGVQLVGTVTIDHPALTSGTAVEIPFASGLGMPPTPIELATPSGPITPVTLSGGVLAASAPGSLVWTFSQSGDDVWFVDTDTMTPATLVAGSSASDPRAIAVDANGIAWTTYAGTDEVRRFDPTGVEVFVFGTTNSRIVTDAGPGPIAIDIFGNAWIGNATDRTVTQIDAFGRVIFGGNGPPIGNPRDGILGPAIPFLNEPRAIAADPAGSVWVVAQSTGMPATSTLTRLNRTGARAVQIALGSANPSAIVVDRLGFAWITIPNTNSVQRRASDGSLAEPAINVPGARSITLRRGVPAIEVWVVGGTAMPPGQIERIHRIRPNQPVVSYDSPFPTEPIDGITTDGAGRIWIASGDSLHRLDFAAPAPAAPSVDSVVVGADLGLFGDATGYTQALFFADGDPTETSFFDFDGDGAVNLLEFEAETDVFDATSTPNVGVLPVQGLTCTSLAGTVSLSWANAQVYSALEIFANGVLETTLPGTATTVDLLLSGPEIYTIEVVADDGVSTSAPRACEVVVGPGEIASATPVFAMTELVNPFDLATTDLTGPCVPVYFITDPNARQVYCADEDGVVMGSFSSDIFQGDFGATGVAYDTTGDGDAGSLFLLGGADTEQVEIREVDLDGNPVAMASTLFVSDEMGTAIEGKPGSLTLRDTTLAFTGPDGCVIFALAKNGTGSVFSNATFDHPLLASGFGLNGVEIVENYTDQGGMIWITGTDAMTPGEYRAIEVSVAAGVGVQTGREVTFSQLDDENALGGFSFAPDPDTGQVELSVVGLTTSTLYDVTTTNSFVRGDSDGDGMLSLGDCIATLDVVFGSGTLVTCEAALDCNDDGQIDIGDAIYTLQNLFGSGPPPPAPYPDAGGAPFECIVP